MNSYERVIAALERRQPDRVPYFESVIDERLMQALLPGCDYYQFNDWLGMDNVGQNRSSWSRDNVEYVDKEKGLFRDKWGVIRAFGPESTPAPVEGPIKRPEDLKTYTPPDPEAPDVLGNIPEIVARYKGKKAITAIGRDAFFNPAFLRGMEQFLIDMIENPDLVHELIEITLSHDIRAMQRVIQAGVDVIIFGDDYADKNSPLMSPAALQGVHPAGPQALRERRPRGRRLRDQAHRRQHHAHPRHDRRHRHRRPESPGARGRDGHRPASSSATASGSP